MPLIALGINHQTAPLAVREKVALDADSLERCMQRLDAPRRACLVFAFVDGFTHEQIAQRLNTPLGTVKSWIRRSLASLKECLA